MGQKSAHLADWPAEIEEVAQGLVGMIVETLMPFGDDKM